jgi:hypothetical protein
MCFKNKSNPITPVNKRALLFAINDYTGSNNDLRGCVNDQIDVIKKLNKEFPGFDIRAFKDSEVTKKKFISEIESSISLLKSGATVILLMDCCFSGTITRFLNSPKHPTKNRFFDPQLPPRPVVNKILSQSTYDKNNWIVISGCGEKQTSADAYINKRYNGAFTYYALKALTPDMSYLQWFNKIREYLPSAQFEQSPELEGSSILLNRVVFSGEVLLIHNSSHGTYTYDTHGDEEDGQDEAVYLYDGPIIDDDIHKLLDKIPT